MDDINPLKDCHCDNLNQCLQSCAETAQILAKMRAAGMPAEQIEALNEQQRKLAAGLKAQFFPNRP